MSLLILGTHKVDASLGPVSYRMVLNMQKHCYFQHIFCTIQFSFVNIFCKIFSKVLKLKQIIQIISALPKFRQPILSKDSSINASESALLQN